MSTKVKRFYAPGLDCMYRDNKDAPRELIPMVLATDYDALHAEAEALRAELDAESKGADKAAEAMLHWKKEADSMRNKLAEAQALLRDVLTHRTYLERHAMYDIIAAFLTSAPAQEVQAEQGERQEAQQKPVGHVFTMQPCFPGEPMRAHAQLHVALPAGTKLYAEPQPGPDVRALVEALEQIQRWDGFPPTGKFWEGSGAPMSYSTCYGSNGERDFMRNVAANAISAHHQTQQGDSHDT